MVCQKWSTWDLNEFLNYHYTLIAYKSTYFLLNVYYLMKSKYVSRLSGIWYCIWSTEYHKINFVTSVTLDR